ncbi:hypothetical protein PSECIP111951_03066 [Pseudoalteromonas holothuriae]|uniref:CHASE2 domain-containing protein n=1 Tax=Pseudoalteromonas holothuriae TaxID=2963714 RepID=A0A9W4QYX4_9GAMM|nr:MULTISPECIES: hypothetical protein [unclassified Pseudoalteromonas]CAH9059666.1 hypothetical protein PSECIP111854_02452 [Pseudoalteromonas sp. CIP111854]CAH9064175.1 hypothetical protein PSECIP111951_03066 [Pseudoalteromonas sp. CIP111951]
MQLKQQYFIIRSHKAFWSLLTLLLMTLVLHVFGVLQSLNTPFLSLFNKLNSVQATNVTLIESANLYSEHDILLTKINQHRPKAVIIFSNIYLQPQEHLNKDIFYPHQDSQQCLPSIANWGGYNITLKNLNSSKCIAIWQRIFPEQTNVGSKLINFSLAPHALPKFTSERIISDDILSDQLKNKIIFITQRPNEYIPAISAPKLDTYFNPAYLHAYVAHSLDTNTLINPLDVQSSTLLHLIAIAALIIIYQRFSINLSLVIASILTLIWITVGYFLFKLRFILIPVGEFIFITYGVLFWIFFAKKWVEEDNLLNIIGNIQQRMLGRYLPKSFINQSDPWDPILILVKQQLALKRSIFFAREEGDHRLKEIRATNCELSHIQEMRRDYQRAPYSDAIKQFGTVKVTRPFFKNLPESESQYLVPLMYAGDVRGFWAMTVEQNNAFDEGAFTHNVNQFANQIGELLFHHNIFLTQQKNANNIITRALTLNIQKPLSQRVKHSIKEMEQKLMTLEHVFNQVGSASILFNLFGHVIQTNHALENLAQKLNLAIFDITALDLLSLVTNMPIDTAKGKLRFVTLHKGELHLPVELQDEVYILAVRTINASDVKDSSNNPFEIGGILFEFINISDLICHLDDPSKLLQQLTVHQDSRVSH